MTFNGETDEDRLNKLKMFNILWNSGYICRLEVPVRDYSLRGMEHIPAALKILKREWTDIDVLGWKYEPYSGIRRITASAKGKAKNTKDKGEIFKLAGVNQIYSPIISYYIKDDPSIEELFLFAKNLDIQIISKNSIMDMLDRSINQFGNKSYHIILKQKGVNEIGKALKDFKQLFPNLYQFSTTDLWNSTFPLKYYLSEESFISMAQLFEEKENYSSIILLYVFSNYFITISEIISKVECCRLIDFNLFLMKTMEAEASGSEMAKNVYNTFTEILRTVKTEEKIIKIANTVYRPERFFPEFKRYSKLLKECWKKNYALFNTVRIIDFLMINLAETSTYFNVDDLPLNHFPNLNINKDSLYLIRLVLSHFIENKKTQKLANFGKLFNILR